MKIVADENIPFVREAFGHLGEVMTVPGRSLKRQLLRDADILLVRSVTRVDRHLIEGTRLRFIATATIGKNHIDESYLKRRGIRFASAAGSNANSVAEYIIAALLVLSRRGGFSLRGKTLAVIGVGNVGSRVVAKARALDLRVLQNDPPLKRSTRQARFLPLREVIRADFATLHVPLTKRGRDATYHMVDERFLNKMKPGAYLINTSRGAVVEERALKEALLGGRLAGAVLDVWENEPHISFELMKCATLATAHIAGYSFEGKVGGTAMVYREACEFLRVKPKWRAEEILAAEPLRELVIEADDRSTEGAIHEAVTFSYDIESDDSRLRAIFHVPPSRRAQLFDKLRRDYPRRREFSHTRVVTHGASPDAASGLRKRLRRLGFSVA